MNLFEIVKYGVSCREAAERYGVEVNRYGMALCPFHNDRHPSLYVADDHYHCFACGEHGDVIDFAAKLFGLPLYGAAQNEGWEKQYPYKVGKKKVYMTPSAAEAQELIRADKHPKSTRYGRQNPISERWNSEDQLAAYRPGQAAHERVYPCRSAEAGALYRVGSGNSGQEQGTEVFTCRKEGDSLLSYPETA